MRHDTQYFVALKLATIITALNVGRPIKEPGGRLLGGKNHFPPKKFFPPRTF